MGFAAAAGPLAGIGAACAGWPGLKPILRNPLTRGAVLSKTRAGPKANACETDGPDRDLDSWGDFFEREKSLRPVARGILLAGYPVCDVGA
jgi:hypothetical protein